MSALEETLALQVRAAGLPDPVRELRFHPSRRWRLDFAWPSLLVAAEVDGGAFVGGRHTRGLGFENDCEKLNAATALGWRVLRFTSRMVKDGQALSTLEAVLDRKEDER